MNKKQILLSKPSKNPDTKIECIYEEGLAVITYPKNFGRLEKWFHERIGGPDIVRRPLDKYTTHIWNMCNGKHSVKDIINELDEKFGEEVTPAATRVQKFLEKLLELNLITLTK